MKRKPTEKDIDQNFFNAMSYELAGDIGAIDNEEMLNNEKLITAGNSMSQSKAPKKK